MFLDRYEIHETIGEGGFAKVKIATHKLTRERVAIKVINRKSVNAREVCFDLEIKAMKELSHENICQLYEHYENETNIYLVLEHCSGGELFEYIVANDRIPESDARLFFRQIIAAVAYIHQCGYAHRDLKPENLLLNENGHVKLTDFGLCARPDHGLQQLLSTRCGSPCYIAPEILEGYDYLGCKSDVWSLGVLLFTLVAGYLPFEGDQATLLLKSIKSQTLQIPSFLSASCRSIIMRMLDQNPKTRATVEHLCADPWTTNFYEEPPVIFKPKLPNNKKKRIDMEIVKFLSDQVFLSVDATRMAVEANNYEYLHSAYLIMLAMKKRGDLHKIERYYRFQFKREYIPLPPPGSCVDRLICNCEDSSCLTHVKENSSSLKRKRGKRFKRSSPLTSPIKAEIKKFLIDRSMCALKRRQQSSLDSIDNEDCQTKYSKESNDDQKRNYDNDHRVFDTIYDNEFRLNNPRTDFGEYVDMVDGFCSSGKEEYDESMFQSPSSKKRAVFKEIERSINAAVKRVFTPIKRKAMEKSPFLIFTRRRGPKLCKDQINVCPTLYSCSVKLVFALEHVLTSLLSNEKIHFERNVYTFRVTVRDELTCKLEIVTLANARFGVKRKRIGGSVFTYKSFTTAIMSRLRIL